MTKSYNGKLTKLINDLWLSLKRYNLT